MGKWMDLMMGGCVYGCFGWDGWMDGCLDRQEMELWMDEKRVG